MAKKICVLNAKGGVAKTAVSTNTAFALARLGFKTLLIDLDAQGNAGDFIMKYDDSHVDVFVEDMLMDYKKSKTYLTRVENLHLIPSSLNLLETEKLITISSFAQHNRLSNILKKVEDDFDYIIVDTPPNLGVMVLNAYMVADFVIIPVESNKKSIKGINITLNNINGVVDSFGMDPVPYKVLLSKTNNNIRNREYIDMIAENFEKFKTEIRYQGKPFDISDTEDKFIFEIASSVTNDYAAYMEELLQLNVMKGGM